MINRSIVSACNLDTVRSVSEMTYTVSSGMLNPSIPYHTTVRCPCCAPALTSDTLDREHMRAEQVHLVYPERLARRPFSKPRQQTAVGLHKSPTDSNQNQQ